MSKIIKLYNKIEHSSFNIYYKTCSCYTVKYVIIMSLHVVQNRGRYILKYVVLKLNCYNNDNNNNNNFISRG